MEYISNSGELEAIMAGIDDDDIDDPIPLVDGAAIWLEVWVGMEGNAEGYEQVLTIEQLKQLAPLIGKGKLQDLLFDCEQWGLA